MKKHSHCSFCGARFGDAAWPRTCGSCGRTTWRNPLPVAVLVQPVDDGVLLIRRGEATGRGQLALPGGFIDLGETWQQACARELREESGVVVDAGAVTLLTVHTATAEGFLITFGLGPALAEASLPPFSPNAEVLERLVVRQPTPLAFSLHARVLREYFEAQPRGTSRG